MKKKISLLTVFLFAICVHAQKLDGGVNLMTGLPMGDYSFGGDGVSYTATPGFGIGGGLEANYWMMDNFSLGLELGFISFGEGTSTQSSFGIPFELKSSATAIPIMLKGNYYFMEDEIRPYLGIGVGYFIMNRTIDVSNSFFGTSTYEWSQNGFLLSPRLGLQYELSRELALHINVQYNMVMNKVEGDKEVKIDGVSNTITNSNFDPTNYLGINIGVVYTLQD